MRIHRSKAHDGSTNPDRETLASVYEAHDSFGEMREALDADVSVQTVRRWIIDRGVHTPNGFSSAALEAESGSEEADSGGTNAGASEAAESADASDDDGSADARGTDEETDAGDVPVGHVEVDGQDGAEGTEAAEETDDADVATGNGTIDGPGEAPTVGVDLPASVTPGDLREAVEEATTLYEVQKRLDLDREAARELLSELGLLKLVHGRVADQRRREELKQDLDERFGATGGHAESSSD
jgi:hypothetical protein